MHDRRGRGHRLPAKQQVDVRDADQAIRAAGKLANLKISGHRPRTDQTSHLLHRQHPVEYLWAWLKRHAPANFCPANLAELQTAARNKLNNGYSNNHLLTHSITIQNACHITFTALRYRRYLRNRRGIRTETALEPRFV